MRKELIMIICLAALYVGLLLSMPESHPSLARMDQNKKGTSAEGVATD
jgi:hypothetical protein